MKWGGVSRHAREPRLRGQRGTVVSRTGGLVSLIPPEPRPERLGQTSWNRRGIVLSVVNGVSEVVRVKRSVFLGFSEDSRHRPQGQRVLVVLVLTDRASLLEAFCYRGCPCWPKCFFLAS